MPLSRITIRQLEAFLEVADTLSFSKAGSRLGLTSSAVSQLVRELEATLGFRLFDRSTRRVTLSGSGRDFLPPAQTAIRHVRLAEAASQNVRNRSAGIVRVGAPLVLASMVLPAAVRDFRQRFPGVAIQVRHASIDNAVDHVAKGDLDLALCPDRPPDPEVERVPILTSPWVLWCSASHPLARRKSIRWEELNEVAIIAAGRDQEVSISRMRGDASPERNIARIEVADNISIALGIAAQGLAVTLAPTYVAVSARLLGLQMKRIVGPQVIRQLCLYRSASRALQPAAEGFGEFLIEWTRRWCLTQPSLALASRGNSRHVRHPE